MTLSQREHPWLSLADTQARLQTSTSCTRRRLRIHHRSVAFIPLSITSFSKMFASFGLTTTTIIIIIITAIIIIIIILEVTIKDKKERIGPIQLRQGILQGGSSCVRLFTLCLNQIAWWLRSTDGYTYSHNKQEKSTHLLYVDDLETHHKSSQRAFLITNATKSMFEDIGLFWALDKCAMVNVVRCKIKSGDENVQISDTEEPKLQVINDHYKLLGKYENSTQLEEQVCNESSKAYLKRESVIWSSNISIPSRVHATKTFALPALQYHMWTSDWTVNKPKDIDRRTREIIRE